MCYSLQPLVILWSLWTPNSRQQRENGKNKKIQLTTVCISLCSYLFPSRFTLPKLHISKKVQQTCKFFKTLNSLLCPHPPLPTTSLTVDDFANFFIYKTTTISSHLSASQTLELRPTTFAANNLSSSSFFICCSKVLCIEIRCSKQKTALTLMEELNWCQPQLQMFFSFYFAVFSNSFFFFWNFYAFIG